MNAVAYFFISFIELKIDLLTQIHIIRTSYLYALAMQVRCFFAQNCKFNLIRGPPVQFNRSESKE